MDVSPIKILSKSPVGGFQLFQSFSCLTFLPDDQAQIRYQNCVARSFEPMFCDSQLEGRLYGQDDV